MPYILIDDFRFEEHKIPKDELSKFVDYYLPQIVSLNIPQMLNHVDFHVRNIILDEQKGMYTRISIDGLVLDCSISIANALEILQSCTKPSICWYGRGSC